MQVTVRSVLALPAVIGGHPELIAGQPALDAPVRWVHVSEQLEIAELLQGGELVLTTGLMIGSDPTAASAQLVELERAGAAGVVVELPAGREPTLLALRAAAAQATLPVVILHRRVRFVDITEAVHRLIVAEQLEQLEANRRIHETFTDLALSDASPAQIVGAAASMLGSAVLLEDPEGRVVQIAGTQLVQPEEPPEREAGTAVLVSVRESAWGRLLVPDRSDATARHVAERAAQALALHLMAERDARDLAALAQSAFLAELAQWPGSGDEAEARAASLGLASTGRLVSLCLVMPPRSEDPLAASRAERALREDVRRAVAGAGATALMGHAAGNALTVLLAPGRGAARDATMNRVARDVLASAPGERWMGVGPSSADLIEAAANLAEAHHVAQAARQLGATLPDAAGPDAAGPATTLPDAAGPAPARRLWFRASDVRLPGLMAMLASDPRCERFASSEVGPLLAPGREQDLALVRALVETGGSKQAAATRLFLSRPAVYHRITKVEDELGVSLSDPASLTSLAVALLIACGPSPS